MLKALADRSVNMAFSQNVTKIWWRMKIWSVVVRPGRRVLLEKHNVRKLYDLHSATDPEEQFGATAPPETSVALR